MDTEKSRNGESNGESNDERGERYSRLLIANRRRIYGFIFTLVHDHAATEDVLQDVSATLWTKFDKFEPGTDFAAWAMSIARFKVLNWRRKQAKLPLNLDDVQFEQLADAAVSVSFESETRRSALATCLAKLSDENRMLIRERYTRNRSVASIAAEADRSRVAIYKRMSHLQTSLLHCINERLRVEGLS